MRAQKYSFLDEYLKLQKNLIFFAFICIFVLTGGKNCVIIIVALGYSQAVRHQTLTLAFSLVRIQLSQPEKSTCASKCFFQLYSHCGEFYCFAVIFGLRRVVFASRVWEANIISLWNEVEQYHCRLRQYHADEVSISLKTFRL